MGFLRSMLTILLCVCLIATSFAADNWVVREGGVGPVIVGMTLARLNVVLHEKFALPSDKEEQGCFFVSPSGYPQISLMIENQHLVRVDVDRPGVATTTGIQVGDTEAQVRKIYGASVKVSAHAYVDNGHYLTVRSADGRYGVRFETDNGKITGYYAGTYDAIQYIEGCE